MNLFWAIATVAFAVVEAATVGLTSIWFALGALFALVFSALLAPLWLQIVVFLAVSIATLLLTRPLAKKYVNNKHQPTNADRLLGTKGIVTETIDNLAETGTVSVSGKLWTARSTDGSVILEHATVTIQRIEGVKLIVTPYIETPSLKINTATIEV